MAQAGPMHFEAARRLLCARCGNHRRQPPYTVCALCRSIDASRAAALGWRRRSRWLAQRRQERLEAMVGPLGDLSRAIAAAHEIEQLAPLRALAAAAEGMARAAGDRDQLAQAADVRRLADQRIAALRRAMFGFRSAR